MKKVFLCILDGYSIANPDYQFNAIFKAKTPNIKRIISQYPMSMLKTSGLSVGLPEGQMGNSEVGHMTIGSGRVIYQDLPKIDKAIVDGSIFTKSEIIDTLHSLKLSGKSLHLIGLCSDGGVHSHSSHIVAIANFFTNNGIKVHLHLITDGRDVAPQSFDRHFNSYLLPKLHHYNSLCFVSTACGRYYAMDRDKKMDRTKSYYNLINSGDANELRFTNLSDAIQQSYSNGVSDEFINPLASVHYKGVEDGDSVLMANFRSDRARQIFELICDNQFFAHKISMTHYSDFISQGCKVLFTKDNVKNTLGEVLSQKGLRQLHIAETEKYAHVTFFFNGGREEPFEGEDRILINSPSVATYDIKPEMSLPELQAKLIEAISSLKYDFIVCNIANGDMVGHSGNFEAAKKAAEHIDSFLASIEQEVLKNDYTMLITADHGNLEEMVDSQSGEIHTQHTTNDVQFIYVANDYKGVDLKHGGLNDIAPSILSLLNIAAPDGMDGVNLVSIKKN